MTEREIFEAWLEQKIEFTFQLRNIDDHDASLENP